MTNKPIIYKKGEGQEEILSWIRKDIMSRIFRDVHEQRILQYVVGPKIQETEDGN